MEEFQCAREQPRMEIQAESCLNLAAQEGHGGIVNVSVGTGDSGHGGDVIIAAGKPRLLALPEGLCRSLRDKDQSRGGEGGHVNVTGGNARGRGLRDDGGSIAGGRSMGGTGGHGELKTASSHDTTSGSSDWRL